MSKTNYENRTSISIMNDVRMKLEVFKDEMKLKSLNETISIMADAMRQVQFEKKFTCKSCGDVIEMPQNSDPKKFGLTHRHLGKPTCVGCIETSYQAKISKEERQKILEAATEHIKKTEMQKRQTDANDKNRGQTNENKIQKTQEEIEAEEWEKSPINPKNYVIDPD